MVKKNSGYSIHEANKKLNKSVKYEQKRTTQAIEEADEFNEKSKDIVYKIQLLKKTVKTIRFNLQVYVEVNSCQTSNEIKRMTLTCSRKRLIAFTNSHNFNIVKTSRMKMTTTNIS